MERSGRGMLPPQWLITGWRRSLWSQYSKQLGPCCVGLLDTCLLEGVFVYTHYSTIYVHTCMLLWYNVFTCVCPCKVLKFNSTDKVIPLMLYTYTVLILTSISLLDKSPCGSWASLQVCYQGVSILPKSCMYMCACSTLYYAKCHVCISTLSNTHSQTGLSDDALLSEISQLQKTHAPNIDLSHIPIYNTTTTTTVSA